MLVELAVVNLVIVAEARMCPGEGLTVVSGETGAGKSLLLDALDLLLGGRARTGLIGPAGDSATVSAVFSVDADLARAVEAACGVPASDGQVILRRRLGEGGRSQAWINDVPVTVAALRAAGDLLVEVRAQNEATRLSEPARQLDLLDGYGGHPALAEQFRHLHQRCLDLAGELARLDGGERESLRERDFLRFQQEELTALDPKTGELATLEERQRALAASGQWQQLAAEAAGALGEGKASAVGILAQFARKLAEAPDRDLRSAGEACAQALEAAREAARLADSSVERLQADPVALARTEERLDGWYRLMRKHGEGEVALLGARAAIDARVAELDGLGERRDRVAAERAAAEAERQRVGSALGQARAKAFAKLAKAVHGELAELGMPKARLTLLDENAEASALGLRRQEFLICTNPGQAAGRLATVPSGGEAARLTLALAVALAEHDRTPVLVFDEVDSGVGGRLGALIGAKLAAIARGRTVLAVTHTPQLAAAANRQYVVRKNQGDRKTTATVAEVAGEARMAEIADMLGGGTAAVGQARALLAGGAS